MKGKDGPWKENLRFSFHERKQRPAHRDAVFQILFYFLHLLAALAELESLHHRGKTDEDVDNPLHCRPAAEEHVDHVEVAAEETAKADETPVEGTDDDEDESDFADTAAAGA